ncbi:MAG TPA: oligosaccharide flippase family protein [Candidatus Saccharimonadales bacterium]|nr:oligosaccharide flippase family protein [Candidatus Saccharimonadales bacterium]
MDDTETFQVRMRSQLPASVTKLIGVLRSNVFLRHNIIFFVGSLAVGFLNYLYYPVLGRMLPPAGFGEVQTLFSLFAQTNIFLSVLGLIAVTIVTNYKDTSRRDRMLVELERLAVGIGVVLLALVIVFGGGLARFFHFGSLWPFVTLMLAVLATVPLTFRNAFLRGHRAFGLVIVSGMVAAGGDLLFSIVLVAAGWGTTGAIAGLVLAQFAAFLLAAYYAGARGFAGRSFRLRLPDIRFMKPELRYALLVLVGSLAITALYSMDIVVVKHFFDARTAGLYAGIATVARIIFFLTASICQVLLPSVRLTNTTQQNRAVLLQSFALLVGVGGAALLAFTLLPRFVVGTLIGGTYVAYAHVLPWLALTLFVVSILNLFIMYHVALRRFGVIFVVLAGMAATFGFLQVRHGSLLSVVTSLLYGSVAMLAFLGVWLCGRKRKQA